MSRLISTERFRSMMGEDVRLQLPLNNSPQCLEKTFSSNLHPKELCWHALLGKTNRSATSEHYETRFGVASADLTTFYRPLESILHMRRHMHAVPQHRLDKGCCVLLSQFVNQLRRDIPLPLAMAFGTHYCRIGSRI